MNAFERAAQEGAWNKQLGDLLVEEAQDAIACVFNNSTLPLEETRRQLEGLQQEIGNFIAAIDVDISENKRDAKGDKGLRLV